MGKTAIDLPKEEIEGFCRRWKVREFSLFGSVLRDGFRPDSDIDVILDFAPDAKPTLFDLASMADELETILGRKVDLVTREAVEQSDNYIRRNEILSSIEVVYVS
jgi:predicted nucleotidyltransferase